MLDRLPFVLRQHLWGRWRLRRGLPRPDPPEPGVDEHGTYLRLVTALLGPKVRARMTRVVDVGCRNWSYLSALAEAFPRARLVGVEVDGLRRHLNGFRRLDYARAQAAALGGRAEVVAGDFLRLPDPGGAGRGPTLVTFLFPFVTPGPCRAWGLPAAYANFAAQLGRARRLGAPGGLFWLGAHQGAEEGEVAQAIYDAAGLRWRRRRLAAARWAGRWPSPHDSILFWGRLG